MNKNNKEIRYKGMISNKGFKIIDTIIWVSATLGIILMLGALYELNEVNKDIKELKTIMRK